MGIKHHIAAKLLFLPYVFNALYVVINVLSRNLLEINHLSECARMCRLPQRWTVSAPSPGSASTSALEQKQYWPSSKKRYVMAFDRAVGNRVLEPGTAKSLDPEDERGWNEPVGLRYSSPLQRVHMAQRILTGRNSAVWAPGGRPTEDRSTPGMC